MDQGFAYWREDPDWNLARTLAAADAFLAADDGRPTFLLVHTYRVHAPYRDRTAADGSEHQDGWDALRNTAVQRGPDFVFQLLIFLLILLVLPAMLSIYEDAAHALSDEPHPLETAS